MRAVKEMAYAKINLYLDVTSKRADGFHGIKTIMHKVSLCDMITVVASDSKSPSVHLQVKGNKFLPTDSKNLAVKAAELYLKEGGINANISIKLEKHIPVAAGLAGGSSDAAAVLRAMNRLYNRMFTEKALLKMSAELGSDVPFCLYGKTALCCGRGEILTKLNDNMKLDLVIATAGEYVSTPAAYSALDELYSDFNGTVPSDANGAYDNMVEAVRTGRFDALGFYNIFESVILPKCPGSLGIKARMTELGAEAAMMSGSGPSVFGVFPNAEAAARACEALRAEGIHAYTAKSI